MTRLSAKDVEVKYEEFRQGTDLPRIDVLNEHFYFMNSFMHGDYISVKFGVQCCDIITNFFKSWNGYLHEIMVPNPQNMISINEHNMFDEDARNKINALLGKVTAHIARNTVMVVESTKEDQVQYILDSIKFWEQEYKPQLKEMVTTIRDMWAQQQNE